MSNYKRERAEQKNEHGKMLHEMKQYGNALRFFDEAINYNPNVAKYWNNRAACYIMMGNYFKAISDAKKSITIDEKYANGYKCLSKCNKILDDIDLALKYIVIAHNLDPSDKDCADEIETLKTLKTYETEIKKLIQMENYRQALAIIEKYLGLVPESKKYRLLTIECYIYIQQFEKGSKFLYKLLSIMPNDEDVLYMKALHDYYKDYILLTYESLQNMKRKLSDHLKVSQLYRDAKKTLDLLHLVNEKKDDNQLNDAYVFLDEAIKTDPKNFNTNKKLLYQKITIAKQCPELNNKVISDCNDYLNKYERNREILLIRAEQFTTIQEYENAIDDFQEVYTRNPSEQNRKQLDEAKTLFDDQLKSNYKILKIDENEIDEIKIKKAYEELNKDYELELKNADRNKADKIKLKIMRVLKAFNEIMKGLESDEEISKTSLREAPKSYPRKASNKFSTIQRAKRCISQQNFAMATELLNKIPENGNEEAIYTQTSLIFYEKNILEAFDQVKQNYQKIPNNEQMKKLFEKAEKTYKLLTEANNLIDKNQVNEAYQLLTKAEKIDNENKITNKYIYRKKISLGQNYLAYPKLPTLKYNVYKDCSLFLTKYGHDLEILRIRATHSLKIGEYEDARDDFKELLNYEDTETNQELFKKASDLFDEESKDNFRILRIDKSVIEGSKIKKAFQDLLLLYHPDKNSWATPERKTKLERKLFRVKDAYNSIKDELKLNI